MSMCKYMDIYAPIVAKPHFAILLKSLKSPIMANGQMQIFKCWKLRQSQIWRNTKKSYEKHENWELFFIDLGITLHTGSSPPTFYEIKCTLKAES